MGHLKSIAAAVICAGFSISSNALGQSYPVYFPAFGEDLPYGHFWHYSHPHDLEGAVANDFFGIKFNENNQKWEPDVHGASVSNEETVLWSVPVRAAADGEVIACWRQYADGQNGVNPFNAAIQTNGGNHLVIRTNDNHIVFYAHFRKDTIPTALCPNSGPGGAPNDISDEEGSFPKEFLVPAAQRAQVKTGQYLGRVGHSGFSSGPHLHFHVQKITESAAGVFTLGDTVPARFYGAVKAQAYKNGSISENWKALNGHVLNNILPSGKIVILPEESRRSSISSRKPNRLDVLTRSKDRQLQVKSWNGSKWSGWTKLGGALTSNPSCASWSQTRIDCFARGTDMQLKHIFWTQSGGWSNWADHEAHLTSAPAVVARDGERLDVFARGPGFAMMQKSWNGSSWSGWKPLGGKFSSAPACTSWSSNRIDCVARGRNKHLWHAYWNGQQWSGWTDKGGVLTSSPAISSRGPNRLDIFARGQDNHLYIKQWDEGGWSNWADLGGVLASGPSAVSYSSSRIDVQAVGQNGNLWHKYWTSAGWSNWTDLGAFFQ